MSPSVSSFLEKTNPISLARLGCPLHHPSCCADSSSCLHPTLSPTRLTLMGVQRRNPNALKTTLGLLLCLHTGVHT